MTSALIVADAGPLIGLAVAGRIEMLHTLFEQIRVPAAVLGELQLEASRPGSFALSKAKDAGWLSSEDVPESTDMAKLTEILDRGEAEAIALARSREGWWRVTEV